MSFISNETLSSQFEGDGSEQTNPKLDLHLRSPIRDTFNVLFMDALKLYPHRRYNPEISNEKVAYTELPPSVTGPASELIGLFGGKEETLQVVNSDMFGVTHDALNQLHNSVERKSSWLPKKCKSITKVLHEIVQSYDKRLLGEFQDGSGAQWEFNNTETGLYILKIYLEDMRDTICRLAESRSNSWELRPYYSEKYPLVLLSRSLCVFLSGKVSPARKGRSPITKATRIEILDRMPHVSSATIVNYEMILCILDTVISRLYTLYTFRLMNDKYPFKVQPEDMIAVYKVFDSHIESKGNDIYKQIKVFESLVTAHIIHKTNVTSLKDDFRDYLLKSSSEEGLDLIAELDQILCKHTVPQCAEIFGVYRHWGHPIVDEAKGCEKIKKIVRSRGPVDEEISDEILGALTKQFVFEFISQMKRWPNCNIDRLDADSKLRGIVGKNIKYINDYTNRITLKEWSKLDVMNELDFDSCIDYLDPVSDKAIAPLASEVQYGYNSSMSGIKMPGKPTTNRRLLTEILARRTIDIKEICHLIQTRSIPSSWYVIKICPKERELNNTPRMFSMMPLEMRLAYCVLESNIAKKVFNFYPQQSMNLGEEKLSRRLINMATVKDDPASVELIIGIDFTSWNIHWSAFNTHKVARMVSNLFGMSNLYEFCHEYFSLCEVSLSSSLLIPEKYMSESKPHLKLPEDQYLWGNHMGGLEGICQKLWTLITIGLLLVVESRTGIKAQIIGQGDNQVCKITVPLVNMSYANREEKYILNDTHIRSMKDKFMRELTAVAEGIGLKLKALESWVSEDSASYSKDIIVSSVYQSQLGKRINRMMPDVSEDYPTFPNRVSSLQSAGFSASQKSYVMALPWVVAQVETGLMLFRDISQCRRHDAKALCSIMETEPFMRFFYLSDNSFTGIPLVGLGEYEFRGHPDPMTTYLSTLHRVLANEDAPKTIRTMVSKIWAWLDQRRYPVGDASPELLISNPTAVNIKTPDPINHLFKKMVFSGLQANAKNEDIKEMFSSVAPEYDRWFFDYLIQSRPCYPRLLNVIMTHSPTGARLYIMGKILNTKTVNNVVLGGVKTTLDEQVKNIDIEFFVHLCQTYRSIQITPWNQNPRVSCPTMMADDIRMHSYKKLMGDDKIVGVTMPHPMHVLNFKYEDTSEPADGFISVLAPNGYNFNKMLERGNQPPFIGTKTLEKVSGRIVTVSGKSRPFGDVCRLVQMLGWAVAENGPFGEFLRALVKCRTNVPFEILEGMSGRNYFGSHIHRTSDPATKKDVRGNIRHSISTHFAYSSDRMGITTRGGDDYNIQPPALFLYATREIVKEISVEGKEFRYLRGYLSNKDCCMEAYDNVPACHTETGEAPIVNSSNPLLYADMKNFQALVLPESYIVKYHDDINPSDAVGYYLMSRYRGVILSTILTSQDPKPPYLTRISMSEVLNIGIVEIVRSFAKYLYLYLSSQYSQIRLNLATMSSDMWCGIAELCLIPDALPLLCHSLGLDGTPDLYKLNNNVHRLLNELLIIEIDKIHNSKNRSSIMRGLKFFILDTVKFPSVMTMWWESLCSCYTINADLRNYVFKAIKGMSEERETWNEAMDNLVKVLSDVPEAESVWKIINQGHLIRIMKQPPEFYFRRETPSGKASLPQRPEFYIISPQVHEFIHDTPYPIAPYLATITHSEDITVSLDDLEIGDDQTPRRRQTRMDQSGRLVGNLSTAWCKYLQIVIKSDIALFGPIVCTADGESSVGICLSRYSQGQKIYYNSLQSRDILTQRYEGFVPGSFIYDRDCIAGQNLSLIYGGDLTDMQYLSKFISILPDRPSLLTCDAETSGEFDPEIRIRIVNSLLRIIGIKRPEACIIKDFLGNLKLLSATISAVQQYYHSVEVVVPHYSSFESLECFVVAKVPRDVSHQPASNDKLFVKSDFLNHLRSLSKMKWKKVSLTSPTNLDKRLVRMYCVAGDKLGFHTNLTASLFRITQMYPPIDLSTSGIPSWIAACKGGIISNIISLCRCYGGMSAGSTHITKVDGAQLSSNPSCSRLLRQYAFSMLSISALTEMLNANDIHIANMVLSSISNLTKHVIEAQGYELYTLTSSDIREWESQHLKPLWRVWGHFYHGN